MNILRNTGFPPNGSESHFRSLLSGMECSPSEQELSLTLRYYFYYLYFVISFFLSFVISFVLSFVLSVVCNFTVLLLLLMFCYLFRSFIRSISQSFCLFVYLTLLLVYRSNYLIFKIFSGRNFGIRSSGSVCCRHHTSRPLRSDRHQVILQ